MKLDFVLKKECVSMSVIGHTSVATIHQGRSKKKTALVSNYDFLFLWFLWRGCGFVVWKESLKFIVSSLL